MDILYGLAAFAVLLVLLPVRVGICGRWDAETQDLEAWFRPMLGLFGVYVRLTPGPLGISPALGSWRLFTLRRGGKAKRARKDGGAGRKSGGDRDPSEREADSGDEGSPGVLDRMRKLQGDFRRFRDPAFRCLKRLARSFRVRRVDADVRYGASTAEATGRLFGYVQAALCASSPRRIRLRVDPVFTEAVLEGKGELDIGIVPLRFVSALLLFGGRVGAALVLGRLRSWIGRRGTGPVPA